MEIERAWTAHRRHVLDLAFRMLGDFAEAEDVVQEAFARLSREDVDGIDDVRGWLVVAVSRRCIDQLRSPHWSRVVIRSPTADDFAALFAPHDDVADRVALDERVGEALLVVLERMSPAERTAFVLHDVFGLSFPEIATAVGRTPAACRQLASRARRASRDAMSAGRFVVDPAEHRRVVERFVEACSTGDTDALLAVLDCDVAGQADLGGAIGLLPPVVGRDAVAERLPEFLGPTTATTLLTMPVLNGPCVVAFRGGRPAAVVALTIRDRRVVHIHAVVDPEKIDRWGPMLGVPPA
ncbi:MAG: sigma-70 family RNA polymerase sigma factor [Thermoleophilia bacterium]